MKDSQGKPILEYALDRNCDGSTYITQAWYDQAPDYPEVPDGELDYLDRQYPCEFERRGGR